MLAKLQVFQNTSPATVRLEVLVSQEFTNKSKQPKHVKLRDLYHFTVTWEIFSDIFDTKQRQNCTQQKQLENIYNKTLLNLLFKLDCKLNQFDARLYNN